MRDILLSLQQEENMILRDIAILSMGLTVRGKPDFSPGGAYSLLQLGDISADGYIMADTAMPVDMNPAYDKFVLIPGDLVFRGRGAAIAVAVFKDSKRKLVATAPLIIIRPNSRVVDSIYLAWFLSSQYAKKHFSQHISGSSIMGIGKRDLETVEVTLPDMKTQKTVGDLMQLQKKEQELAKDYLRIRQDLINHQIEATLHHQKPMKKAGAQ